jgi:hypothetical protein
MIYGKVFFELHLAVPWAMFPIMNPHIIRFLFSGAWPPLGAALRYTVWLAVFLPVMAFSNPVVLNPSFELDPFTVLNGRESIGGHNPGGITGWLHSNLTTGVSGDRPNPFVRVLADNGAIPDGQRVAFIQGNGSLSQLIAGLTPLATYQITYFENANQYNTSTRQGDSIDAVSLGVKLDGEIISEPHPVSPVGEKNPYRKVTSKPFQVPEGRTAMKLTFDVTGSQNGKGAVLLDNVEIQPVGDSKPASTNGGHLKYFGQLNTDTQYFGSKGIQSGIEDFSNVAWVENYGPAFDIHKLNAGSAERKVDASLAVELVKQAREKGMKSHVVLHYIFFDRTDRLIPDWKERFASFAEGLKAVSGDITSFSVIDEPFLAQHRKPAELKTDIETVNRAIKVEFPEIPISVIYAFRTLADINNLVFPDGYDWLAFDGYPLVHTQTYDNMEGYSLPWFYNVIRDRLKPGQKTFIVPELHQMGAHPNPRGFNPQLINNYNRLLEIALADPLCIGVFNYTYFTFNHPTDKNASEIGMESNPHLRRVARNYKRYLFDKADLCLTPYSFTSSRDEIFSQEEFSNAFDAVPETEWVAKGRLRSDDWIQLDYMQPMGAKAVRFNGYTKSRSGDEHASSVVCSIHAGSKPEKLQQIGSVKIKEEEGAHEIPIPVTLGDVRFVRVVFEVVPASADIILKSIDLLKK